MNKSIAYLLVGTALLSGLSGCMTIPDSEYSEFKPLPRSRRVMQITKLTWEVRPDASAYCSQKLAAAGHMVGGMAGTPVACSTWDKEKGTCVIVTNTRPNHLVLGHELRHCFEGHFH